MQEAGPCRPFFLHTRTSSSAHGRRQRCRADLRGTDHADRSDPRTDSPGRRRGARAQARSTPPDPHRHDRRRAARCRCRRVQAGHRVRACARPSRREPLAGVRPGLRHGGRLRLTLAPHLRPDGLPVRRPVRRFASVAGHAHRRRPGRGAVLAMVGRTPLRALASDRGIAVRESFLQRARRGGAAVGTALGMDAGAGARWRRGMVASPRRSYREGMRLNSRPAPAPACSPSSARPAVPRTAAASGPAPPPRSPRCRATRPSTPAAPHCPAPRAARRPA